LKDHNQRMKKPSTLKQMPVRGR